MWISSVQELPIKTNTAVFSSTTVLFLSSFIKCVILVVDADRMMSDWSHIDKSIHVSRVCHGEWLSSSWCPLLLAVWQHIKSNCFLFQAPSNVTLKSKFPAANRNIMAADNNFPSLSLIAPSLVELLIISCAEFRSCLHTGIWLDHDWVIWTTDMMIQIVIGPIIPFDMGNMVWHGWTSSFTVYHLLYRCTHVLLWDSDNICIEITKITQDVVLDLVTVAHLGFCMDEWIVHGHVRF